MITREDFETAQAEVLRRFVAGRPADIYLILAAKMYGVPERSVTQSMRIDAKTQAYIYAYSNGSTFGTRNR